VGRHEKNSVLEISFKYAPRGVELVKARSEGAAPLPTEPRGQRESARPIAYIKARTTAVRRVTLSVVHRYGRMHTLATKKLRKISCPPTFKKETKFLKSSEIEKFKNSQKKVFDVEALYTNIDNRAAYQAVVDKLKKNASVIDWYGDSFTHIKMLLKSCLEFNGFQFDGRIYEQKRGLAMGSRLAPVLAVLYMDIIETPSKVHPIILFRSYIDDYIVVAESQDTLDNIFTCLNSQATHIRLTREAPKMDWLSFLNCELRFKNKVFSSRWYRKPSNKNLLIRMDSGHPKQQKINTISTTQKTATENSTIDQRSYSRNLANEGNFDGKKNRLSNAKKSENFRSSLQNRIDFV
ncbi:Protein CBG20427, partial [Caenorhabditis briggsae]